MNARERYVLLGLARPRTKWFNELGRWATTAVLPLEYSKAVAADEVRVHLGSGRVFSALIVESGMPGLDRDLVDGTLACGCAVIVVDDGRVERDWDALGVSAVLSPDFDRGLLLATLDQVATGIGNHVASGSSQPGQPVGTPAGWPGRFVSVTGPGGTGASTAAVALAQVASHDVRHQGSVVLSDLALHADQAVLHDSREMMPGLPELVDAHRSGSPPPEDVRRLCFSVDGRGYDLLLGLRRHRDWTVLRPRAVDSSLSGLQHAYGFTVADIDPDVEGETQCGSIDVEERNLLARHAARRSDAIIVVGEGSTVGIHHLLRVVGDLTELGVEPERIVPVINRSPRSASRRGELTRAVSQLLKAATGSAVGPFAGPVFLPERRKVEAAFREGKPLPHDLGQPLATAVDAVIDNVGPRSVESVSEPVAVAPGSLGKLTDPDH